MARERIIAPNLKLQEERLRRAWSQQELADLLGTTHNNVSRWERGLTRPNLYFRLKLREVFALTESQLGLKAKETEVLSPSARAPQPIFDPLIPLPPAPGLVGRDELLNEIKKRILSPPALAVSALNGLPGAGKTALAAALAHDPQVISHFHGGVLWVGLGPQPDLLALYSRWGTLLGLNSEKLTTLEEWAVALRMAIGARPMFLLIDDAWRLEHALAVKLGGPQCAYLLTTRLTEVAIQFSLSTVTTVAELSEQQSFSLLSQLAPEVVRHDSEATRDLIDAVGGLPLALTLMGNYLRTQAYSGQLRRLLQAIEKLRDTEVRLSLNEPRAFLEQVQALPPGEPVSLQAVIAVSDQRLSEQARSALRAFSVFPPKPNSFTEEAALAVCALPVEVLDQLQDFGLLESNGSGRYTLHQTIADYARTRRAETASAVEERFVSYIARFTRAHKTVYLALEAERANIIAALEVAFMRKLPIQYVQIVLGFAHYLCVKGMYSTAEYHVKRALAFDEPDVATHSELLNFLGVIAKKYGRLAKAEGYHRQGLMLARRGENIILEVEHLSRLAILLSLRQQYSQASSTFQEALGKARSIEDPMKSCTILNGLALVCKGTSAYAAAQTYIQQGLDIARQYGLIEREVTLLINASMIENLQRNTAQGEILAQQALSIAQAHGLNESLAYLYNVLSELAMDRDDYEEALARSTSCLALARQLGHVELIGGSLCTLGTAYGRLDDFEQAETTFQEAMQILPVGAFPLLVQEIRLKSGEMYVLAGWLEQAQEVLQTLIGAEEQDIRARALFGLVRVFTLRGEWQTARDYAQQCVAVPGAPGHVLVPLQQWLETYGAG